MNVLLFLINMLMIAGNLLAGATLATIFLLGTDCTDFSCNIEKTSKISWANADQDFPKYARQEICDILERGTQP